MRPGDGRRRPRREGPPVFSRPGAPRRWLPAAVAAVVGLVLTGCRIDVTAELDLRADGSGSAELELFLDRELLTTLDELEVDVVSHVEAAAADAGDWSVDVEAEGAEGVRLHLVHHGSDPAGALGELSAGLASQDPGLFTDLDVTVREDSDGPDGLELAGTARVAAPRAPGVVDEAGEPLGPDAATLEALADEHVTAALVATLPGTVRAHDADVAEGATLRWELPVGRQVEVRARSSLPTLPVPRGWLVAGGAVLLLVAALVTLRVARRR